MKRNLNVKVVIIVAMMLICVYGIIGIPKSKDELIANWKKNIRLGLDLRGGSQLVMQVQLQDAFNTEAATTIDRLKDELRKAGIEYTSVDLDEAKSLATADKVAIDLKGVPAIKTGQLRGLLNDQFGKWVYTALTSTDYKLTMKPSDALTLRQDALKQTLTVIDRKINAYGLSERTVQPRGRSDAEAEILIQLPGEGDPARIKQSLQTVAKLEWYEVKDGPFASREEALTKHGGVLPLNTQLMRSAPRAGQGEGGWYLLTRTPVISGTDLRDAHAGQGGPGEMGRWVTNFVLTQDAAKRFERYTEANIGNRAAIVVDKQIISAPTINGKIGDSGMITGAQSQEEAADLALNLRAGALPASVIYLEETTVGPSLGADSIRSGFISGLAGVAAVVLVMLAYYKKSGINATLALVLNAIILIAALSYFEAVLTLPGIAGVILTIGMAVDSNVLIFERIREELRGGKTVVAAVDAGFSKAFLTIIDTHVTTVVSCCFLFIFGTGPVRGFAVTLVIGLLANVFTAVFVSKVIFDWELSRQKQVVSLSI